MRTSIALLALAAISAAAPVAFGQAVPSPRERVSIDDGWRFTKGDSPDAQNSLTLLQVRAGGRGGRGGGLNTPPANDALWPFILATSDPFIADPAKRVARPEGNPGAGVAYAQAGFDDASWRKLDLPHDFGIEGPFIPAGQPGSDGGTGRLPFFGQAWYRKHLEIPASDAGREIYLDMDGAMSYAEVFLNGQLVGGWPYGYASWRVDLTPYVKPGGENVLAIRLDNPPNSSRWYPGGGIYRNVWLTKTSPVHVGEWGTYVTTPTVSAASADVSVKVSVENDSKQPSDAALTISYFSLDEAGKRTRVEGQGAFVGQIQQIPPGGAGSHDFGVRLENPKLWSPKSPNRYVAVVSVAQNGKEVDTYETPFGIRTVKMDPNEGLSINGEHYKMNGVCDHHDLGALGTAVNYRALQRQLEILKEMGCNAIRTSHNPPAPELLDLADQMGFMVMDETFDTWRGTKTPNDYGRIFDQWHEQDTRALIRRDRNHPSVVLWSIGNEVGEQGQGDRGAAVARELSQIAHEEDPTRPTTAAENSAGANSPFPAALDAPGLNYQGAKGSYLSFHRSFPDKMIFGSETESTISTRGEYTFPVAPGNGAVAAGNRGEDTAAHQMSSYDLYYPGWATSPDTEFAAQDRYPFVGGEFVWTGFDYIGEPTPWGGGNDPSRSSYFGIIDLAGFPKDRYYLYQAHWRSELPMAHILPHWNWPERAADASANPPREAQVTPVHVYTSGDEAELFLNGKSLGRKKKGEFEYRIRWDDVVYEPGELKVVAYKDGKQWATDTVKTTGAAAALTLKPDRASIANDGHDLSFITLTVVDKDGLMVPRTHNPIHFDITGPGEIVATDNGDPTDQTIFASHDRKAFNGLALVIVKAQHGGTGPITITATSEGLGTTGTTVNLK